MDLHYPNPELEAELAMRRDRVQQALRQGSRRNSWFAGRRRRR